VTATETLRALRRAGWEIARQSGSHASLTHSAKPGIVVLALHRGITIPPGTLKGIIDQAGLTVDEFRALL
jgi:predicted RNA binding protein YcfA (HicA-like mRNA interferase family)